MSDNNMIRLTGFLRAIFMTLMFVLLSSQALAQDIPWGELWNNFNKYERVIFILGYVQGYRQGVSDASSELV